MKSKMQLLEAEVKSLAFDTFGTKSKANEWLNTTNLALGVSPKSLNNSESGLLEVKKLLIAISYGGCV